MSLSETAPVSAWTVPAGGTEVCGLSPASIAGFAVCKVDDTDCPLCVFKVEKNPTMPTMTTTPTPENNHLRLSQIQRNATVIRSARTPNENELSHRWRGRAWQTSKTVS